MKSLELLAVILVWYAFWKGSHMSKMSLCMCYPLISQWSTHFIFIQSWGAFITLTDLYRQIKFIQWAVHINSKVVEAFYVETARLIWCGWIAQFHCHWEVRKMILSSDPGQRPLLVNWRNLFNNWFFSQLSQKMKLSHM